MGRRMETDAGVVVMGEDVHRLNGGTNGATRGLKDALPRPRPRHADQRERLRRPRRRHRARRPVHAGGRVHVRRLHVGRRRPAVQPDRQGPAHVRRRAATCRSCCAARWRWAPATARSTRWTRPASSPPSPGWRIVAPSTPFDYVGLMNSALRCQDPVVVLEHVDLYTSTGPGPVDDLDYCLPVGKAAVRRAGLGRHGAHLPGDGRRTCCEAVEELGEVDAEVIDLRWLDRASIDWDTIGASITQDQQRADRRAGRASARRTAAGWPTRSSAASSTGSTSRSSGSPAARRRRASARCSSAPRSPRATRSPPRSPR